MNGTNTHTEECQILMERVLSELVEKYDVQWLT
jgi:hypothetical protein